MFIIESKPVQLTGGGGGGWVPFCHTNPSDCTHRPIPAATCSASRDTFMFDIVVPDSVAPSAPDIYNDSPLTNVIAPSLPISQAVSPPSNHSSYDNCLYSSMAPSVLTSCIDTSQLCSTMAPSVPHIPFLPLHMTVAPDVAVSATLAGMVDFGIVNTAIMCEPVSRSDVLAPNMINDDPHSLNNIYTLTLSRSTAVSTKW